MSNKTGTIKLDGVNLPKFMEFIDMLTPLTEASTIYFKLTNKGLVTDSYDESCAIIKSVNIDKDILCVESNLDTIEDSVKLCFYNGKMMKKMLASLNGTDISCEIKWSEIEDCDDEKFATNFTIKSPKLKMSMTTADPTITEFANVPFEDMEGLKNVEQDVLVDFKITPNEISQIQKLCDFDTEPTISFCFGEKISIKSNESFDLNIDDNFESKGQTGSFKIDKQVFKIVDSNTYSVFIKDGEDEDGDRKQTIVLKSADRTTDIILTVSEESDI